MTPTPEDYKSMISRRCENLKNYIWPEHYGLTPIAAGTNRANPDAIPDFEGIKNKLQEIMELVSDYETSIGPA